MSLLRSLRAQGAAILLALVLAMGLVYGVAAFSALRETTGRVASEGLDQAHALARRYDGLLQLGAERLAAVGEQPGLSFWLAGAQPEKLSRGAAIPQRETLHYLFFQSAEFNGPVALIDRHGDLLWTEPYDEGRIAARPRLSVDEQKPAVMAKPLPWRTGPAALLVQPIVDLTGRPAGALLGEIDFEGPRVAAFAREPGAAALLGPGDSVLSSSLPQGLLDDASFRSALPAQEGTAIVDALGSRWLVARAQLGRAPWSALLVRPVAEAFAPLRTLQFRLVLAAVLLALATALLSLLALNRLVRPVEGLTEAARGVPSGDFARPVPQGAPGELGDLVRAFVSMRAELQATLQGLRESEERFRRSIDSANDPIFAVDLATLRVLHVNRRAAEAGIEPGADFASLVAPADREAARAFVARVAGEGEGKLRQMQLASGLPLSVSASLIVYGGGRFAQLICRDLTERQKMERELVQAEKLSTLGLLAAGIVHELNTPLAYLSANLELAEEQLRNRPTHEMIADALEGARRAAGIVKDLRVFARGEGGPSESCDLNEAVRMALRMAHHELKYRAQVVSELGQLPRSAGRATELSQVFLNLLVNAAHAMNPPDPARHCVTVTTRMLDGCCVAKVSDTGAGIAPEALPRIFDAFYTTKPEGVGTGLGLAISRDIVQRAGGKIEVESVVGKGTTFTIELPAA